MGGWTSQIIEPPLAYPTGLSSGPSVAIFKARENNCLPSDAASCLKYISKYQYVHLILSAAILPVSNLKEEKTLIVNENLSHQSVQAIEFIEKVTNLRMLEFSKKKKLDKMLAIIFSCAFD